MIHNFSVTKDNLGYIRRNILKMSIAEVSRRSGLSEPTIKKAESGGAISVRSFTKLRYCYESECEKLLVGVAKENGYTYRPILESPQTEIQRELFYYRERKRGGRK